MSQELQKEEERWAQEDKENSFQFGLSSKVILEASPFWPEGCPPPPKNLQGGFVELLSLSLALQVLKGHADKAPQITEEFGRRVAHCCLASLAEFLQ
ncbi:hypothetical protein Chor_001846, partial [Crotalus horridus]